MPNFVHLHVHSDHSLLDGYGTIKEYVSKASELGMPALALTDHNTMTGIYTFIEECKNAGIKPICGIEFNMTPELDGDVKRMVSYDETRRNYITDGTHTHLTVLAKNNTGLHNLFKLINMSFHKEERNFWNSPRITLDQLIQYKEGLIILSGCPKSELNVRLRLEQYNKVKEYLKTMRTNFKDDFYIEIMDWVAPDYDVKKLVTISKNMGIKGVITNDVHYLKREDSKNQELLMAMNGSGHVITETPTTKGGLRPVLGGSERYFKSFEEMVEVFPYEEYKDFYDNTLEIADKVETVHLEYNSHLRPRIEIPKQFKSEIDYFDYLIEQGFKKKRSHDSKEIQEKSRQRIKEEREVIYGNDFVSYFLVVRDYIQWANANGYPTGLGRGCFLPKNKVTLKNNINFKYIKNVKVGDEVLTHNGTYQKVEKVFEYDVDEDIIEIELDNGESISCTLDHLIYTADKGFVKAKDLSIGTKLLGFDEKNHYKTYLFDNKRKVQKDSGVFISEKQFGLPIFYKTNYERLYLNQLETDSLVKTFGKNTDFIYKKDNSGCYIPKYYKTYYNDNKKYYFDVVNSTVNDEDFNHYKIISKDFIDLEEFTYKQTRVKRLHTRHYKGKVYDLKVNKVLNYTINGVTVHNSAGGSEIGYLLEIHDTDPLRWSLLFERFLSDGRGAIFEIEYEDGSKEQVLVNKKFMVNGEEKYTWQLEIGDIVDDDVE